MKVIFLDIDGVMNHNSYFVRSDKHDRQAFCPEATENLRNILVTCKAKIVLSSTWRKSYKNVRRLRKELFSHYGLNRYVIGLTPVIEDENNFFHSERGVEIRAYMDEHGIAEEDMVIIDDGDDMNDLMHRLVQTSYENGLTKEKAEAVIQLLSNESGEDKL